MRLVDYTATHSDRRLEPRLDALTRDRHVDVHRVAQWFGPVEILRPDRRSVSKGIDRIVVGHAAPLGHNEFPRLVSWKSNCRPIV
jgi:hypothetical protein